jgi:hypothetical protein
VRGGVAELHTNGPEIEVRRTSFSSRRGRGQSPAQRRRRGNIPFYQDLIHRLDQDRDGRISKHEFDGPVDHFNSWDRNNDGFISKEEVL